MRGAHTQDARGGKGRSLLRRAASSEGLSFWSRWRGLCRWAPWSTIVCVCNEARGYRKVKELPCWMELVSDSSEPWIHEGLVLLLSRASVALTDHCCFTMRPVSHRLFRAFSMIRHWILQTTPWGCISCPLLQIKKPKVNVCPECHQWQMRP